MKRSERVSGQASAEHTMSFLAGSLSYWIRVAELGIFSRLRTIYGSHGVTGISFAALTIIGENPGINQAGLARLLGVETPRIVPILNAVEENGLAERRRSLKDRRNYELHLTRVGEIKTQEWKLAVIDKEEDILGEISDKDRKILFSVLYGLAIA